MSQKTFPQHRRRFHDELRLPQASGSDVDLPGGRGFVALLEAFRATGGTAPGDLVARLLVEPQVGNAVSPAARLGSDLEAVVHAAQPLESPDEFPGSLARRAREVAAQV